MPEEGPGKRTLSSSGEVSSCSLTLFKCGLDRWSSLVSTMLTGLIYKGTSSSLSLPSSIGTGACSLLNISSMLSEMERWWRRLNCVEGVSLAKSAALLNNVLSSCQKQIHISYNCTLQMCRLFTNCTECTDVNKKQPVVFGLF